MLVEAWKEASGAITVATRDEILEDRSRGLLSVHAVFLHVIEADTFEEALARHHEMMGWEPYVPLVTEMSKKRTGDV